MATPLRLMQVSALIVRDAGKSLSRGSAAIARAGIASGLDVPVYMLVISFALEDEQQAPPAIRGPLADLAAWTGGDSLLVRDTVSGAAAATQILAELRHQYVIAFEPGSATGWHPVVLRARKPGLIVRARSGYIVK